MKINMANDNNGLTQQVQMLQSTLDQLGTYVFTKVDEISNSDGAGYVKNIRDHLKEAKVKRRR